MSSASDQILIRVSVNDITTVLGGAAAMQVMIKDDPTKVAMSRAIGRVTGELRAVLLSRKMMREAGGER